VRALITGAGGFVGRHLAAFATSAGAEVIGLGRGEPAAGVDQLRRVDLLDVAATAEAVAAAAPDAVFHLAARASVGESWNSPEETVRHNVMTTHHVLAAVREHAPAARVLIAGSGEQYGAPSSLPIAEDHPLAPRNPYALSKAQAELVGGFYADAHGLDVVRTRAFNHAGPGQADTYVISALARRIALAEREARAGETVTIEVGNTAVARDFTDVRDVVRAYWLALESAEPGTYNVASGRAVAIARVLELMTGMAGVNIETHTNPDLLRPQEAMEVCGSAERLRAATGWEPQVPLQRTLADTLDWWRTRLGGEAAP
jgi:GDP-4-dehydro-6-deoxy-D-mannose reductase